MVLDFYNLKEQPFGVTPNPDYLYLGATHRNALESIRYAIRNRRGFMSLVATPGMGKTTLLLQLLKEFEGYTSTAFLFQTMCGPEDLLRSLLDDLGLSSDGGSISALQAELQNFLRAEAQKGRSLVVAIDEAQYLSQSCLELVRMLSNFETTKDKLVQVVLAGQPQLGELLASPSMLQLRQRIAVSARLQAFDRADTRLYIDHRLLLSGYGHRKPLFSPEAVDLIADRSQGVPRNINNICFTALTIGTRLRQSTIRREVICEALQELDLAEIGSDIADASAVAPEVFASTTRMWSASRGGFPWKSLGVLAVIVFALLFFSIPVGKLQATRPSPLTASSAPLDAPPGSPPKISDAQNSALRSVGEQPSSSETSIEAQPTEPVITSPRPSTQSRDGRQDSGVAIDDTAKLWAQVKMSDSDAEVKLAQMFLEGTSVDQNCAQAEILLLDASRKGNVQATSLLHDHPCQYATAVSVRETH